MGMSRCSNEFIFTTAVPRKCPPTKIARKLSNTGSIDGASFKLNVNTTRFRCERKRRLAKNRGLLRQCFCTSYSEDLSSVVDVLVDAILVLKVERTILLLGSQLLDRI